MFLTYFREAIFGNSVCSALFGILDILFVCFVLYRFLVLAKGTKSMQIAGVVVGLTVFYTLLNITDVNLGMTRWFLNGFFNYSYIIIIVLFYDEIRTILSTNFFKDLFSPKKIDEKDAVLINEIVEAVDYLASIKEGALIVIMQKEKKDEKDEKRGLFDDENETIAGKGTTIDAVITKALLLTIFKKNSALHDGAVIIQDKRIARASVFFSLSTNPKIDPNFGTRHRAAYGISEKTDCTAIVVSEERGEISLLHNGKISRDLDKEILRNCLANKL